MEEEGDRLELEGAPGLMKKNMKKSLDTSYYTVEEPTTTDTMSESDNEIRPQPEMEPMPEHDDIDDEAEYRYTSQDMDAFKERQQKEGKIREHQEEDPDVVDVRSL